MEDSPVVLEPNTTELTAWAAELLARHAAEPVRPDRRRADDTPETTLALAEVVRAGVTDAATARFSEPDRQRMRDLLLSGDEHTWPLVDGTYLADLPAVVRDWTSEAEVLLGEDRHAFAIQVCVAILERLRRAATADELAMNELWRDFTAETRLAEDRPSNDGTGGGETQYAATFHSVDTVVQAGSITEYHFHAGGIPDPRHVSPLDESDRGEPRRLNRRVLRIGALIIVAVTAAVVMVMLLPRDEDPQSPSGEQVDTTGSEDTDPRDQSPTSAEAAAMAYLRYGSIEEPDRTESVLCEGASPAVSPADLAEIRDDYADELGGITGIDVSSNTPVTAEDGILVEARVTYISTGVQRHENLTVTVQELGDEFCVSDAAQSDQTDPSSSASNPEDIAAHFVGSDPEEAQELQCATYAGLTPDEVNQAISDWESQNGEGYAYVSTVVPAAEAGPDVATVFDVELVLQGDFAREAFTFVVTVEGNCVASMEGGEGLISSD